MRSCRNTLRIQRQHRPRQPMFFIDRAIFRFLKLSKSIDDQRAVCIVLMFERTCLYHH